MADEGLYHYGGGGYIVEYGIDQNGLINDVFKNVLETFAEDED